MPTGIRSDGALRNVGFLRSLAADFHFVRRPLAERIGDTEQVSEPQRNSGFPILPGELAVRFGCGAAFGLLAGLLGVLRWVADPTWVQMITYMVLIALACGFLARELGDSFWGGIRDWWRGY